MRALFLINPHNPLGIVYREEDVRRCVRWARDNGVHCIVDEIYANSVWVDDGAGALGSAGAERPPPFVSALDICASEEGTDAIVHVLWGASKDLGMSGFRVGVLHTRNAALLSAFANVNYFTTVSNHTQDALTQLLRDEAWIDEYMRTSRRLLRESYEALAGLLRAAAIPFVEAHAGMFVWIDLRRLLRGEGFAAERALTRELFDSVRIHAAACATHASARSALLAPPRALLTAPRFPFPISLADPRALHARRGPARAGARLLPRVLCLRAEGELGGGVRAPQGLRGAARGGVGRRRSGREVRGGCTH